MPLHRIYSVKGVFSAEDKKVRCLSRLPRHVVGIQQTASGVCESRERILAAYQ